MKKSNPFEIYEIKIIACIFDKLILANELYIDEKCFLNLQNRKMVTFLKKYAKENKIFTLQEALTKFPTENQRSKFVDYYTEVIDKDIYLISQFYEYQEKLQENYRNCKIDSLIKEYEENKIDREELVSKICEINNENLYLKQKNSKKTSDEILELIRGEKRNLHFNRFKNFNNKLSIQQNTICVIAARPSEGKSALALNLFCDLSRDYKCLYFNMEMTEAEIYERMLGIESSIPIADIKNPQTEFQDKKIKEFADRIYNYKYELVHGSKNINSIKSKIIKEQREEHLIVFIDYIGYVTAKYGMNDKDRIGEITRELNNLTKDYNCTIFIIAQINRNGSDNPTMNDLKDSGELEQSADTIILINDPNKENNEVTKDIHLLIPKCRGSKRNVLLKIKYLKEMQRMEDI